MPYRYASRTDVDGRVPERTITHLTETLHAVLPQIRDVPIAHGWCGVLAVPRDWSAGIALDKSTGLGWAGGYVGHGVTATNLAGRTLADLVLDRHSPLTELPWVGHRSPNWEPEPLRWLGVRSMYLAYKAGRLARGPRPSDDLTDRRRRRQDRRPALARFGRGPEEKPGLNMLRLSDWVTIGVRRKRCPIDPYSSPPRPIPSPSNRRAST